MSRSSWSVSSTASLAPTTLQLGSTSGDGDLVRLARITLADAANEVNFNDISQNYKNLVLVICARSSESTTNAGVYMQVNGDTGSNYDRSYMMGDGSTLAGGGTSGTSTPFVTNITGASSPSDYPGIATLRLIEYANTNWYKGLHGQSFIRTGSSNSRVFESTWSWRSKTAITRIRLFLGSGYNFLANSTFTLYGEK